MSPSRPLSRSCGPHWLMTSAELSSVVLANVPGTKPTEPEPEKALRTPLRPSCDPKTTRFPCTCWQCRLTLHQENPLCGLARKSTCKKGPAARGLFGLSLRGPPTPGPRPLALPFRPPYSANTLEGIFSAAQATSIFKNESSRSLQVNDNTYFSIVINNFGFVVKVKLSHTSAPFSKKVKFARGVP